MPQLRNRRHELFAMEVASGAPLASSYVAAGFTDSKFAKFNGSRLAHTPAVAARIDELHKEFADRAGIQAEWIRAKLLPLVEADAVDFFETVKTASGRSVTRLRELTDLPAALRAAIKSIDLDGETGRPTKITLHDKIAAGTALLRSVGGFIDKSEVSGGLSLEALVLASFAVKPDGAGDTAAADGDDAAAAADGDVGYGGAEPDEAAADEQSDLFKVMERMRRAQEDGA